MPTEALYDPEWFQMEGKGPGDSHDTRAATWIERTATVDEYFAEEPVDSEEAIALDKLMADLDPITREVVELRVGGAMSYRHIARHMDWMIRPRGGGTPYPNHKRARLRVRRGLEQLRDAIKADPDLSFLVPEEA